MLPVLPGARLTALKKGIYTVCSRRAKNPSACLEPACGRLVIPDAATFLARLNFRNRNFLGSI